MSIKSQALGVLFIGVDAPEDGQLDSIPLSRRFLARAPGADTWYGFVVTKATKNELDVGIGQSVEVAFLDEPGARSSFHVSDEICIGDGIKVLGTFQLKAWLNNQELAERK